ncbi:MAG: DUF2029 domain-containing protein [Chloroflexota bacterium]|nr:DUF2029 domain-containing protein [Chloroflexota bacterium]
MTGHWLERALEQRTVRVSLAVVLGLLLLWRLAHFLFGAGGRAWGYDFSAYWLAGRRVLDGAALYTQAQLSGGYLPQEPFLYLYPPLLAVLVTPLSALFADYRSAMWLWAAGGALLAGATVWLVARDAGIVRRDALVVLVATTFALAPVVFELIMGNVHLLLLALLGAAWVGLRRGSSAGDYAAGVTIAIATLIKVFPVLLVLWLVLSGRWRAVAALVFAAAATVTVTLPITGIEPWLQYPRVVMNLRPPAELSSSLAPMAALAEWIDFGLARALVVLAGLGMVIWSTRSQPAPHSFALTVMVSLLIVPAVYPHYLALAVLALLLVALYARPPALSLVAWLAVLVGGQLALIDLADPAFRTAALLATVTPVACLLVARRARYDSEASARGLARKPV